MRRVAGAEKLAVVGREEVVAQRLGQLLLDRLRVGGLGEEGGRDHPVDLEQDARRRRLASALAT